jgi:hypothetical protein
MGTRFKRVVQSILSAEDQPMTCEPHRHLIPAYVEAVLDGQNVPLLYPELVEHMETCLDCYEEYTDLLQLLDLERQGRLEEPPRPAQFALSFLEGRAPQPPLWDVTETNVRRLVTAIRARVGTKLVTLTPLPETLMPYRRLALASVSLRVKELQEPGPEDLTEILELPDPEANIRIKLLMGPVQNGRGVVMIQVEELEPLRPLSRVRVTLRDQERHLLESAPTPLDGTVTFKELSVGHYVIEVQRDASRWELELNLEDPP